MAATTKYSAAAGAANFRMFDPRDRTKLGAMVVGMLAIAHWRRNEMRKRWLSEKQIADINNSSSSSSSPSLLRRFVDHPAGAYLQENGALVGLVYLILRFFPRPTQEEPVRGFFYSMLASLAAVEPMVMLGKLSAVWLYAHVPCFNERTVPHDWWTVLKEFVESNVFALAVGNGALVFINKTIAPADFTQRVTNPPPLRLVPLLLKYLYCRLVVDVVFGVAHWGMHHFPTIYNWIHKHHHEHTTPQSPTNFHFHWIDIFMEAFFPIQVALLSLQLMGKPVTYPEQLLLLTSLVYFESGSHTGKEVPNVTWFPLLSPLVNMLTGCDHRLIEYHTRHHQLFKCNYSISPWPDKLMGTYRIDLPSYYTAGKDQDQQHQQDVEQQQQRGEGGVTATYKPRQWTNPKSAAGSKTWQPRKQN